MRAQVFSQIHVRYSRGHSQTLTAALSAEDQTVVHSAVWLFVTPWTAACQASLSITNCQNLLKLLSIESAMPSNHLILYHPLLLLPSIFPSIRVFSNESVLHIRWPKYWSLSFSISPSNRVDFFRIDWFGLAVQECSQYHSSKASNSLVLSFIYSPTLTSIHDCWKNHSFDYIDLCQHNDVSAFEYAI